MPSHSFSFRDIKMASGFVTVTSENSPSLKLYIA